MESSETPAVLARAPRWAINLLSAFTVPGYRWLWASHHLYSTSLMMNRLALAWLVLTRTSSPFWVGAAAGLEGVGKVGFGVLAGALVDRWNKRTLLMAGQLCNGVVALALGALLLSGHLALWHILLAATIQGANESLQAAASNTMLYHIVGRSRVVNGSAGKMLSFTLARITGSALAGALIEAAGLAACYLVLGGLACLAAVPALFIRGQFASGVPVPLLSAIKAGLRYAWGHSAVRQLLTLSITVEMFGFAHYTMVPVIARDVLRVGAAELGWLSSAAGLGALVGTLAVAGLGDFKSKGGVLVGVTAAAGACLVVFAFTPWYGLSLALAAAIGGLLVVYDVLMHALFQLITTDAVRGRVFSLYVLTFGFHPLGGFLAGALANVAGAPLAVGLGGAVLLGYCLRALRAVRAIRPTAEAAASTD